MKLLVRIWPSRSNQTEAFVGEHTAPKEAGADLVTNDVAQAAATIERGSAQITRTGITFVVVCAYFGIIALSISDLDLFTGRTVALPLLDAEVPVLAFFSAAPTIIVFLHLNLLLAQRIFRRSLQEPAAALALRGRGSRLSALAASLAPRALIADAEPERFVRAVLFLLFLVVNVFLPLAVLFVLQVQFLPRHARFMIYWHRLSVLIDAGLIIYLVPLMLGGQSWRTWVGLAFSRSTTGSARQRALRRIWEIAVRSVVLLMPISVSLLSVFWLRDPSRVPCTVELFPSDWISYHLDLSRGNLSLPSGLRLVRRDLRCANFEGLDLRGVDFRGVKLAGTNFASANLRLAQFDDATSIAMEGASPLRFVGILGHALVETIPLDRLPPIPSVLIAYAGRPTSIPPTFSQADLRGASFEGARLHGSDFTAVVADGATFEDAELQSAVFTSASLLGSDLGGAHFEGALLDDAKLTCSSANKVRLDLANLQGARLEAVDFSGGTTTVATDLRGAVLWEAIGLPFAYQNLEGASLWGACPESSPPPTLQISGAPVINSSSLQQVKFDEYDKDEWRAAVVEPIEAMVAAISVPEKGRSLALELRISGLPDICRDHQLARLEAALEADESDSEGPNSEREPLLGPVWSNWRDRGSREACLPPLDDPRSTNLLQERESERLRVLFDWPASASHPRELQDIENRWVKKLRNCKDSAWMKIVLERVFLQRYMGLGHLKQNLWTALEGTTFDECPALESAIEDICEDDPQKWNRSLDADLDAAASPLRCAR